MHDFVAIHGLRRQYFPQMSTLGGGTFCFDRFDSVLDMKMADGIGPISKVQEGISQEYHIVTPE